MFLLVISFFWSIPAVNAQHMNVVVANPVGNGFPTEPAVVINPANTSEILAAGMDDNEYYSADGGLTWTHGYLISPHGGLTWSAPIRINDDPPGKNQFFPALTVDQVTGKEQITARILFVGR